MLKYNSSPPSADIITVDVKGGLNDFLNNSCSNSNRFISFKSYDNQRFALTGEWSIRPNKRGEKCLVFQIELLNNSNQKTGTYDWLYVAHSVLSCPKDYELETTLWLPSGSLNYTAMQERWRLLSVRETMARFEMITGVKFATKQEVEEGGKVYIKTDTSISMAYSKVLIVKKEYYTGRYVVGELKGELGRFEFTTFKVSKWDVSVPQEVSKPTEGQTEDAPSMVIYYEYFADEDY